MKIKTIIKNSLLSTAFAALAACSGHQIKDDPITYSKQILERTAFFPTQEQLAGRPRRVVVYKTNLSADLAKQAKLSAAITSGIEDAVRATGAEIVNRNLAKKLGKEIRLAEAKGISTYKGQSVADFAVIPAVTTATFLKSFSEAYTYENKKKEKVRVPPKCTYTANISGHLDVYEMPALLSVARINLAETESHTVEARSSSCRFSKNEINGLFSEAAIDAINDKKTIIKNRFPPTGYVVELRSSPDGVMVMKSTLGRKMGAAEKLKVDFVTKRLDKNDLTGKDDITILNIGQGVISNIIQDDYAWIVINQGKTDVSKISLGDRVQIEYKDSIWKKTGKVF